METIRKNSLTIVFIAIIALICFWAINGDAGNLNPVAPPSPTMHTLEEIYNEVVNLSTDTRISVQSLSGSASALYVINQPGSYYLTGNIAGTTDKHGIEITTDDVTVDLNGFSLLGPGQSTGSAGAGIYANTKRITIINGSVINWRQDGVHLSYSASVYDIKSQYNGGVGIYTNESSIIQKCLAYENTGNGIHAAGYSSIVSHCIAFQNHSNGFRIGDDGVVAYCSSRYNTSDGFSTQDNVTLSYCTAIGNDSAGYDLGYACNICFCVATSNDYGIEAEQSVVMGNTCMSNSYGNWNLTNCTANNNHPAP